MKSRCAAGCYRAGLADHAGVCGVDRIPRAAKRVDDAFGGEDGAYGNRVSALGVLHRIASSLAEVGLDIRHATVQTLGEDVVDTFYVLGRNGRRIDDAFHRSEIERAVLHAVS